MPCDQQRLLHGHDIGKHWPCFHDRLAGQGSYPCDAASFEATTQWGYRAKDTPEISAHRYTSGGCAWQCRGEGKRTSQYDALLPHRVRTLMACIGILLWGLSCIWCSYAARMLEYDRSTACAIIDGVTANSFLDPAGGWMQFHRCDWIQLGSSTSEHATSLMRRGAAWMQLPLYWIGHH